MFRRFVIFAGAIFAFAGAIFAEETENSENPTEENPLTFTLKFDSIYYLKSAYKSGSSHFAPLDSLYDGIVARTSINAAYTLKMPLGEHFLLKDANAVFGGGIELSPVSLRFLASAYFTPVPFLEFGAGGSAGTGWALAGKWNGMALFNENASNPKYESLTPFADWYTDVWAQATFQMDTGAIWAGDWTHVLFLATAQIFYAHLSVDDGELWEWQATKHYTNGLQLYEQLLLGYQLPLKLRIVGVMAEFTSHLDSDDYKKRAQSYGGDFTSVSISPFVRTVYKKRPTRRTF